MPLSLSPPGAMSRRMFWLQAAVLLLVIGPQWLVTRDLFDGATLALAAALKNPDGLYFWIANSNWVLGVLFFKLVFALSDGLGVSYLFVVKAAVTGMLLGMFFEFVSLGRRLFGLPEQEARLAALLCIASPSAYVFVNSGTSAILLCVWLVFVGHRLFWDDRRWVRVAGLLMLMASFQLNSNLVLALALDVVYLARFPALRRERLKWFVLLFVAAVAVYGTMRMLAPPRQMFVEYNQLLNPLSADGARRIVRAVAMFLTWGFIPLSVLVVVGAASAWRRGFGQPHGRPLAWKDSLNWFALATALFLCAAAAFPYVMVGKGPPLFALVTLGNGLTEQVLRAAHGGPLAPTWASTSGRHSLLFVVPLGFLCWFLARGLVRRMGAALSPLATGALLLPLFLVWMLPAYANKLGMQYAEASLVKGLKALPAAPAGVVDLHYTPVSDWMVWSNAGNAILREAWGKAHYYAMFYSVDAYRDDLQWQYHAYFKNFEGLKLPVVQHSVGMDGFPGEDCRTRYEAVLPRPGPWQLMAGGLASGLVEPAQVRLVESKCQPGQQMPNPLPEKKAIL